MQSSQLIEIYQKYIHQTLQGQSTFSFIFLSLCYLVKVCFPLTQSNKDLIEWEKKCS